MTNDMDFIESQSIPVTESGCWLWLGTSNRGYGRYKVNKKYVFAHRQSWVAFNNREIPKGHFICHKCDTPACVNPSHLFVGTAADNNADMKSKSRARKAKGEKNSNVKLTESQVIEIIATAAPHYELAAKYGVARSTITEIKTGCTWPHIPRVLEAK